MKDIDFTKIDKEFYKSFNHNTPKVVTLVLVSDNYSTQSPASSVVLDFIHKVVSREVRKEVRKVERKHRMDLLLSCK